LNTKYTEDQFVNTDKNHESNQPNINSTIKITAKIAEGLNQSNENSDTKRQPFKTKKAKLGQSLKNGKAKNCMVSILEVWIDSLLAKKTRSYGGRGEI